MNNIEYDTEDITQCLDRPFFTVRDIKNLGIFGSLQAIVSALDDGRLHYIRVSPRRRIVPKQALIEYIHRNSSRILSKHNSEVTHVIKGGNS